jgi:histidine ammonia-lyase
MGATAALKLRQVAENLEQILSLELFCAAQAVDLRRKKIGSEKILGEGTREIYDEIRREVPFVGRDEYLKGYIDAVIEIVRRFETKGAF